MIYFTEILRENRFFQGWLSRIPDFIRNFIMPPKLHWILILTGFFVLLMTGILSPARLNPVSEAPYIVFQSQRSGEWDIWRINIDGSNPRRLTRTGTARYPQWSPDGRWILYHERIDSENMALVRVDLHGNRSVRLLQYRGLGLFAVWSPDGEWIAYIEPADNGDTQIRRMRPDASHQENLSPFYTNINEPIWSKDGSTLIYSAYRDGDWNVYRVKIGESEPEILANSTLDERYPRWSREEGWMLYQWYGSGQRGIVRLRADGAEASDMIITPAALLLPNWSQDGEWVLTVLRTPTGMDVVRFRPSERCLPDLICVNPLNDAEELQILTHSAASDIQPDWSPQIDLPWRMETTLLFGLILIAAGIFSVYIKR